MDPEQYLIADEVCIVGTSKAKRDLGWRPEYRDVDMLIAAYRDYRSGIDTTKSEASPTAAVARTAGQSS